ncbi:metal ABC transporter substrate-binding protein [Candidatus Dojkabacteria bacterium]|nr:metal ABC transporter substrate-binding protein [Candidatus Dojkabacteria bacterium]
MMPNKSNQKYKESFDRRSIPGIIAFFALLSIGFAVFFYLRSSREIGKPEEKITVAATIFPLYDITTGIAGDNDYVDVVQIIPIGTRPENFDPTDAKEAIEVADIVFKVGLGIDDWVDDFAIEDGTKVVDLSQYVDLITIEDEQGAVDYKQKCEGKGGIWTEEFSECTEISNEDCEDIGGVYDECASPCRHNPNTDYCVQMCVQICTFPKGDILNVVSEADTGYNPYYWLSTSNAKKIGESIYSELVILKPEYKSVFNRNLGVYLSSLDETEGYITDKVNYLENTDLIVLGGFFDYFVKDNELQIASKITKQDEIDEEYLEKIEKILADSNSKVIYVGSDEDRNYVYDLPLDRVVTVWILETYGGSENTPSLIDLLRYDIDRIAEE